MAVFVVAAQDRLVLLDLLAHWVPLELLESQVFLVLGDLLGHLGSPF